MMSQTTIYGWVSGLMRDKDNQVSSNIKTLSNQTINCKPIETELLKKFIHFFDNQEKVSISGEIVRDIKTLKIQKFIPTDIESLQINKKTEQTVKELLSFSRPFWEGVDIDDFMRELRG